MYVFLKCNLLFNAGICKTEEDDGPSTEEELQSFYGEGVCKWFNVRMGFGFLSMTNREGVPLDEPVDVFVHQVGCTYICKNDQQTPNYNTSKRANKPNETRKVLVFWKAG